MGGCRTDPVLTGIRMKVMKGGGEGGGEREGGGGAGECNKYFDYERRIKRTSLNSCDGLNKYFHHISDKLNKPFPALSCTKLDRFVLSTVDRVG